LIQIIGAYSITVKELKLFFKLLKNSEKNENNLVNLGNTLLNSLRFMSSFNIPEVYFSSKYRNIFGLSVKHSAKDILSCLGGIKVFFPLILQKFNQNNKKPYEISAITDSPQDTGPTLPVSLRTD